MQEADRILQRLQSELTFDFVRAAGPGGQNVNKVATAVQLRFDVRGSQALSEEAKTRLIRLAGRRVTNSGVLIIEARRYRTQDQNREDAIARFAALVRTSLQRQKTRKKTRPSAASREKRLKSKKRIAEIKKARRSQGWE